MAAILPRTSSSLVVLVVASLACGSALAQSPPQRSPDARQRGDFKDVEELNLDDLLAVTVSIATGRVERVEEAPGIVSVITDEDIRRIGAQTLADVLQTVPGLEVLTDNVGRSRIAVRGVVTYGTSENVLILFNGHRLNDHVNGGATVTNLDIPVHNLKQIEVIRGPGSALFGTNAFVGVINLVPYTTKNFSGVEVSAGAGSFGTGQASIVTGHTIGDLGVSTAWQFRESDGPRLVVPADAQTLVDRLVAPFGLRPASLAPRTVADDRRSVDFNANAAYKGLAANVRFKDERSGGFIGRVDVFGIRNDLTGRQFLFDVGQRFPLGTRASVTTSFNYTQSTDYEHLHPTPPGWARPTPTGFLVFPQGIESEFTNNSRRLGVDAVLSARIGNSSHLSAGVGFEREATFGLKNAGNYELVNGGPLPASQALPFNVIRDTSRSVYSAFIQDTWTVRPNLSLTAGVRHDHYDDFGDSTNPRAALVWRLPRRLHFKALYGRAFRAPTFWELFLNLPGALTGNPALQPSTINTVEFEVGYRSKNLRVSTNYFDNRIRNFIVSTKPISIESIVSSLTFANSPGLDVQGVEFEAVRSFGLDHAVFFNYAYQRPVERPTGARTSDVPSNLANLGLTVGVGRYLSVTSTVRARGERPRIGIDPRDPVKGYGLLNLNVRLKNVFDALEIAATVGNVFNATYYDPSPFLSVPGDYPTPGRNAILKVGYRF